MIDTQSVNLDENADDTISSPVNKYTLSIIGGATLFIVAAVLLTFSRSLNYYINTNWVFAWLFSAFIATSLIPIAIGIERLTYTYFEDHITRDGRQTRLYLLIFAFSEILAPIAIMSVIFGSFYYLLSFVMRAFAFRKLDKTLIRIRNVTGLRTGSLMYQLYGFYTIVTSIMATVANAAQDETMLIYIFIFEGIIQAILMIIVGIKLIFDSLNLREYILRNGIVAKHAKIYGTIKKGKNY